MVEEWSRQSPSTGRGASDEVPELWSESGRGSPRAQVEERATKSPNCGRRVVKAVPEHGSGRTIYIKYKHKLHINTDVYKAPTAFITSCSFANDG